MRRCRAATQGLEFPDPTLLVQLEHIILSHHRSMEFGSPILSKTREALLVNFLDDLNPQGEDDEPAFGERYRGG